jgi:hypothetical protein
MLNGLMAAVEDGQGEEEEIEIQDEEAEQDTEPLRIARDPVSPPSTTSKAIGAHISRSESGASIAS